VGCSLIEQRSIVECITTNRSPISGRVSLIGCALSVSAVRLVMSSPERSGQAR
jgi:hypothetical protein